MIAAISVEKPATMPTIATATTREAAGAAGPALDLVVGDTTLAVVATSGETALHHTPVGGAGLRPRVAPGPELQFDVLVPPCAALEVLPGGLEHQCAGTVVLILDPAPAPDTALPDLVLAPLVRRETATLGRSAPERVLRLTLTDFWNTNSLTFFIASTPVLPASPPSALLC